MKQVVGLIGPVTAALDASDFYFYNYKSGERCERFLILGKFESDNYRVGNVILCQIIGIYDSTTCSKQYPTHAVLIVGYGTENRRHYWLAKNSWNVTWGDQGFFKILRNRNVCGIESRIGWPVF